MKFISRTPIISRALFATALFVGANQALADFMGSSAGVFLNPVGPATMVTTGTGTSSFTWGNGAPPSSLSFAGGAFSTPGESLFTVGTLTYYNGAIVAGTQADMVDLYLTLAFTNPAGIIENFNYTLGLINTLNTGDPIASADYVTLPSVSNTVFTAGGIDYTLRLEFGNFSGASFGGPNEFRVLEGQTASVQILGNITTNLAGVPDGGSTLTMLGLALASLAAVRRQSRKG